LPQAAHARDTNTIASNRNFITNIAPSQGNQQGRFKRRTVFFDLCESQIRANHTLR
jgi:hypothetical protein